MTAPLLTPQEVEALISKVGPATACATLLCEYRRAFERAEERGPFRYNAEYNYESGLWIVRVTPKDDNVKCFAFRFDEESPDAD